MIQSFISKSLVVAFLFVLVLPVKSQEVDELLPIDELVRLEHYLIRHDDKKNTLVFINDEWKQMEDLSFVESAVFIPNPSFVDTFDFTTEQFPNLKSASFRGLFFNQLIGICAFKKLQFLDLNTLNQNDDMLHKYQLYFPESFWQLKKLQLLLICGSYLSDISENIRELNELKVLSISSHKTEDQLFIPWSLLLMPKFCLLAMDSDFEQEELDLFAAHAHFSVRYDYYLGPNSNTGLDSTLQNFKKEIEYNFLDNKLIVKNDSLLLSIPLDSERKEIQGVAKLKSGGRIIQRRNYASGKGNGKWKLKNKGGIQKRKYVFGKPVGRWTHRKTDQVIRNQAVCHHRKTSNYELHGHPLKRSLRYTNFNNLKYFKSLEVAIANSI